MPTTVDPGMYNLVIRPWPKMIFLWPTAVMSLVMAIASTYVEDRQNLWGGIFLTVVGINFMVLTFEFPRATSLTLTMGLVTVVLALFLLNRYFNVITAINEFFGNLRVSASPHFYWVFFSICVVLFVGMFIMTRFDYWVLSPNELIHHHGMLGDVERFSTAGLKLNKEICDIFEYALAGAGRIIMRVPTVDRPIVLENVLNIGRIERVADTMLDAPAVRIANERGMIDQSVMRPGPGA